MSTDLGHRARRQRGRPRTYCNLRALRGDLVALSVSQDSENLVYHGSPLLATQITNGSEYATDSSFTQLFDVRMSKTKEGSLPLVMFAPHPVRGLTEHSTK